MLYFVTGLSVAIMSLVLFTGLNRCTPVGINSIPVEEMKKKYGKPEDKYFSFMGIKVRYRDEGNPDGPVFLLVHGVCSFLETWDGWLPYLKDHYRVVRLDMPGFGITGPAPDKSWYELDRCVDFFDIFISSMNIKKCTIAGNSLGAYVSWNYTLAHPEKVDKLILVDPIGYNQELPWLLNLSSNPVMRPITRRYCPRFLFDIAVNQVYGDKSKVTPEVKQIYYDFAMREGNKASYIDIFCMMRRKKDSPDLYKGIPDLKPPVLVMWGTKDEWIPYELINDWKKDLPSATYVTYQDIGHVAMEEIPERSVKDALAFINEQDKVQAERQGIEETLAPAR
jgi:pimeloyl-ACP methyl ester carboxylesterase